MVWEVWASDRGQHHACSVSIRSISICACLPFPNAPLSLSSASAVCCSACTAAPTSASAVCVCVCVCPKSPGLIFCIRKAAGTVCTCGALVCTSRCSRPPARPHSCIHALLFGTLTFRPQVASHLIFALSQPHCRV